MREHVSSHIGGSGLDFSYINKEYKNSSYCSKRKILLIHFRTNNTIYAYNGISEKTYAKFINAPSQGEFFWQHIRRDKSIPYIKLKEGARLITSNHFQEAFNYFNTLREKQQKENVLFSIHPELAKIEKLDEQEKTLEKQYKNGLIDSQGYINAQNRISAKRDKLENALEKNGYYDEQEEDEKALHWVLIVLKYLILTVLGIVLGYIILLLIAELMLLILPELAKLVVVFMMLCFIGLGKLLL